MTQLKTAPRRKPRFPRMTYEQFLHWDDENEHVEWVNGEVVPMPPITDAHNDVDNFLMTMLRTFVEHYDLGVVRSDPFQMKTGPDLPGRAPDILFVAKRNRRRLHRLYVEGSADLVVEIISPGSRTVDRVTKFREYQSGGVREYWLIDPDRRRAEFYRRGRDGLFHLIALEDGIFRSTVLKGLWLKAEWLWRRPPLVEVLKEWGLI
jgi:Uma2 family endonuclease